MMEYNGENFEAWYAADSAFIIDPDRAPKVDDLAHVEFRWSEGSTSQHLVGSAFGAEQISFDQFKGDNIYKGPTRFPDFRGRDRQFADFQPP